MNKQLEQHKIRVKTGVNVNASNIDIPLKPKGKPVYKIAIDIVDTIPSNEEIEKQEIELVKKLSPGVGTEARQIKKAGKLRYGYKKHLVTDEDGFLLGELTTSANINEITILEEVLLCADLPEDIALKADKGYQLQKMQSY